MLPQILLDDIRFQELVSEARTRIVRHSPGWTDNVSDPGITLIELIAWLTEILTYRINRIPERLHLGLLELVGVRPSPPECAAVDLRFLLAQPGSQVRIPAGTEVVATGQQAPQPTEGHLALEPDELIASGRHIVKAMYWEDAVTEWIPDDDREAGRFVTFAGGGFGTIQIERVVGRDEAPVSLSGRGYLRDNLPGIYSEGDFGMRFVTALEGMVAARDNLPEHLDPVYAPRDVLDLLAAWLGLEHDEARFGEERREIVRRAPELMRHRGTREGLELALGLAFPGVPFRVQDGGSVTWSVELTEPEPSEPARVRGLLRRAAVCASAGRGGAADRAGQAGARELPVAGQGVQVG